MVFLTGAIGFVFGFLVGQLFLSHLLRDYSREEILSLMKDKGKRVKYGLINWAVAGMGAAAFVMAYRRFFLS